MQVKNDMKKHNMKVDQWMGSHKTYDKNISFTKEFLCLNASITNLAKFLRCDYIIEK